MAFVFKAEREVSNERVKTNNDLGPGEYLPLTEYRRYTVNKEPFLSSNKKVFLKINDVPGPGAYYHDEVLIQYLKNIQNEKISEQNDKVHLIAKGGNIDLHPNSEKIGFNSKSKRFKISNEDKTPGPGQYFPKIKRKDKASKLREEELFSKQKIQIKKVNEFQRIPTIPSKIQEFGFEILDNGSLVQKQNPDMYKTFSGEKGDTVGPGSYEIEKPNNWHKTGTEWSKLKVQRDFYKKDKTGKNSSTCLTSTNYSETGNTNTKTSFYSPNSTTNNFNENIKISEPETGENNDIKIKKNRSFDKNIFKCRILNCQRFNGKKIHKKETFETVIQGNYPGPGYYYDPYKTSSFRFKPAPEFKQFFGSKLERFYKFRGFDNQLGPGEYFEKIMNKTSTGFAPFSTTANRFYSSFLPSGKKDIPGPGEYTLRSFTVSPNGRKTQSTSPKGKFGSNEKRFVDIVNTKWKYCVPGPGYYNPEEIKTHAFRPFNTFYKTNFYNIHKNKNLPIKKISRDSNKLIKEKAPPIGLYNPDMAFTIDYKNKKKVFETKNNKVAFDTTYNKKKKHKKSISYNNINIGPGYYYHEKVNKNLRPSPQFHIPENESKNKWFTNSNSNIGPGQYDINNYFDWNKKSFNINFV
jgi:hypothetical protein